MPRFLDEPEWYDEDGNLVNINDIGGGGGGTSGGAPIDYGTVYIYAQSVIQQGPIYGIIIYYKDVDNPKGDWVRVEINQNSSHPDWVAIRPAGGIFYISADETQGASSGGTACRVAQYIVTGENQLGTVNPASAPMFEYCLPDESNDEVAGWEASYKTTLNYEDVSNHGVTSYLPVYGQSSVFPDGGIVRLLGPQGSFTLRGYVAQNSGVYYGYPVLCICSDTGEL